MSLLDELRRRNVIRMAGLYLVGAWLLTQVAGTILPMFDAPAWLPRSIVVLLAIGFLPALVFSWVFELTPDGLKRDAEVPREQSIAPQTARRMDRMIIAVLLLAIVYFGFDKLVLGPRRDAALVAATTQSIATATANPAVDARSIAVLPFVNMSGDAANEYFSDGISEELLNVLARTPELQVAARTSSFSFKGKNTEVPQIARELKVRMVLEGSVRKQDERVRITAQLIDASNGYHVWSQSYDRKLEDIFAVQDEIANAIATELKVKLGAGGVADGARSGTRSVEAHDLYLRGLALWRTRDGESMWEAVALLEQAAKVDPGFAQAYAGQALVYSVLSDYSARISFADSAGRARDFAERALALDTTLPEPYTVLAYAASRERRREAMKVLYARAIQLGPSFSTAAQWQGTALMTAGALEAGLASLERAAALDPRSLVVANNQSWALIALGRYEEARAVCGRALAFEPASVFCLENNAMASLFLGDLDAARGFLDRIVDQGYEPARPMVDALFAALRGRGDRRAMAQRLAAFGLQSSSAPDSGNIFQNYEIPLLMVLLGEHEQALTHLERLAREDTASAPEWAIPVPVLDPIRCDPRFVALVKTLNTTDPHAARLCAAK